nr:AMP-binding protein [Mycolicibacter hiberniae]
MRTAGDHRQRAAWRCLPTAPPERPQYDADVALLQFTSGTTGKPKPVPRHATVLDLIDRLLSKLRGNSNAPRAKRAPMPNLVPLSLSLWAGIYQVLFAFRAGSGVVLMERFTPRDFAMLVKRHRLRSTVLPPTCVDHGAARDDGDRPVTTDDRAIGHRPLSRSTPRPSATSSGRGAQLLRSDRTRRRVVGWSAADAREWGETKLGSVGRPLPGIDVMIADDEVLVRTPTTKARKIDPAFWDRLTADGWFRTGDLGWFDDDGFLWLDGECRT